MTAPDLGGHRDHDLRRLVEKLDDALAELAEWEDERPMPRGGLVVPACDGLRALRGAAGQELAVTELERLRAWAPRASQELLKGVASGKG